MTSVNYESAIELLTKKIAIQRALVNQLLNTRPEFNECKAVSEQRLNGFHLRPTRKTYLVAWPGDLLT